MTGEFKVSKSLEALRSEYLTLLEGSHSEQFYQEFIEQNTQFIPREFVQNHGIHFDLVLRKLAFGADYKSDFVYLSKSSDDWNCVLIEIEKPNSRFFKEKSNDFHRDFLAALQQIGRWKAWFLEPNNKSSFTDGILGPIRIPLYWNPTFIKYILVLGRRSEYFENPIRQRLIASQEGDDFKIITFDSLAESLHSKHKLYVGARRNEFIDILSNTFLSETVFGWTKPEQLRISAQLKRSALEARATWNHYRAFKGELTMDYVLARIRMRD